MGTKMVEMKSLIATHLWFLGIPCWATVLWEANCNVARVVTGVWVVSLVKHNFFDFSHAVVEQAPLGFEIVV